MKNLISLIDKIVIVMGEDRLGYMFEGKEPIVKKLRVHIKI